MLSSIGKDNLKKKLKEQWNFEFNVQDFSRKELKDISLFHRRMINNMKINEGNKAYTNKKFFKSLLIIEYINNELDTRSSNETKSK